MKKDSDDEEDGSDDDDGDEGNDWGNNWGSSHMKEIDDNFDYDKVDLNKLTDE